MTIGRSRFALFLVLAIVAVGLGVSAGYVASRGSPAASDRRGTVAAAASAGQSLSATTNPSGAASGANATAQATNATSAAPSASGATASAGPPAPASPAPQSPGASPTASTGGAGAPAPAPTSATKFDPRRTVVPMAFPLPATAKYVYGAAWRTPRLGVVYPYNQIRAVGPGGVLLRAHDGVDVEVRIGTPVMSPFAGVVVNPAGIWKPWDPQRYGNVVVVRSTEATSRGYYAILVHLSSKSVRAGDTVQRGQVVGKTGISGNAAETTPHLHFELRAPFQITFHYAGVTRLLDDFDPLPSLRAADPKLR